VPHPPRNTTERLVVLANPRAAGGRAGRQRDAIQRAVDRAFAEARVVWTDGPGHASELARELAPQTDILAALGGDGTCHEVVNGLFDGDRPVAPRCVLTVLPFGTGGDLVRSLEIPRRLDAALWNASTGLTLRLDVGHVAPDDAPARVFINVAGAGANAVAAERANRSSKRLGGFLTFLGVILRTAATYEAQPARWTWSGPDGEGTLEGRVLAAFIGNGHWCGGGTWIGRGGSMNDGLLDVSLVRDMPPLAIARAIPHLYDGHLEKVAAVTRARVRTLRLEGQLPLEADGETGCGHGPATFRVLPRILQVRGGWRTPPRPDA
jgi:YegS/Rv2252/BmrU family lipid kinase